MSNIMNANAFRAALSRLGNTPATVDAMARYAVFHGARGQFTPSNSLLERLQDGGMTAGDVGRAALAMLSDGLKEWAIVGASFKGRKGAEYLGEAAALAHANGLTGVPARIDALRATRAEAKDKRAADKAKALAEAPAEDGADDGEAAKALEAARAAQAGTVESRVSEADMSAIRAQAAAEYAEHLRIAQANAARAFDMQRKAEADTIIAAEQRDKAQAEAARLSVALSVAQARIAELEAATVRDGAQAATAGAKRSRRAPVALAA